MHTSKTPERVGFLRLLSWALPYAFRRWPELVVLLIVMLIGIALSVLQPWPMKVIVDHVLHGKPLVPEVARVLAMLPFTETRQGVLGWAVAGTVVLFLLTWLLNVISTYVSAGFGRRMVYDLAADVFYHLQRLSLSFHRRSLLGDTIRRVTGDCSCISALILGALLPVLTSVFTLVTMFSVMWQMNKKLTLLSLAIVPLMVLILRRYAVPLVECSYRQQEAEGGVFNVIEQTLSSIPAVQAYSREEANDARFKSCTDANLAALLAAAEVQVRFKILINLTTALGTAGILWIGGREVLAGALTVGDILVFLAYLTALYVPLNSLMYTSSTLQGAAGSAQRVFEILEIEQDVADRPDAIPLPVVKGHVQIENAVFGYSPGKPLLKNVSIEALPGETVALVGATGAGKTTLVGLIPRFFDRWEGAVLVDGHDVRDVQLKHLRRQIALVLQEPFLFPISIAENIAYGRPEATRGEVEAAARAANAHLFIERLPEGYDTVIGERGATLSGGERQRLSIARALLKDAPILILDEPTSALDAETEALLLGALRRLMHGRTTFIIAHRLSTIRDANKIVVLDNGRVVEIGTHAELLARGEFYARLYNTQFGREGITG